MSGRWRRVGWCTFSICLIAVASASMLGPSESASAQTSGASGSVSVSVGRWHRNFMYELGSTTARPGELVTMTITTDDLVPYAYQCLGGDHCPFQSVEDGFRECVRGIEQISRPVYEVARPSVIVFPLGQVPAFVPNQQGDLTLQGGGFPSTVAPIAYNSSLSLRTAGCYAEEPPNYDGSLGQVVSTFDVSTSGAITLTFRIPELPSGDYSIYPGAPISNWVEFGWWTEASPPTLKVEPVDLGRLMDNDKQIDRLRTDPVRRPGRRDALAAVEPSDAGGVMAGFGLAFGLPLIGASVIAAAGICRPRRARVLAPTTRAVRGPVEAGVQHPDEPSLSVGGHGSRRSHRWARRAFADTPARLASRSPLIAATIADGSWLQVLSPLFALVAVPVALVAGAVVAAVSDPIALAVGGAALILSLGLLGARHGAAAFVGFVAVLVVEVAGGQQSVGDVLRAGLLVFLLGVAVPLAGVAAAHGGRERWRWWERLGAAALVSMVALWAWVGAAPILVGPNHAARSWWILLIAMLVALASRALFELLEVRDPFGLRIVVGASPELHPGSERSAPLRLWAALGGAAFIGVVFWVTADVLVAALAVGIFMFAERLVRADLVDPLANARHRLRRVWPGDFSRILLFAGFGLAGGWLLAESGETSLVPWLAVFVAAIAALSAFPAGDEPRRGEPRPNRS